MVSTTRARVATRGQGDARDITRLVADAVGASGCQAGVATAFVIGSTAVITTIEFED